MKVIVCQHGARRRYAVARILEEAGMLEALYTDSNRYSVAGRILGVLPQRFLNEPMKRLLRRDPLIPQDKVFSSDRMLLRRRTLPNNSVLSDFERSYNAFAEDAMKWGCRGADLFYCMDSENLGFMEYVKAKGKKLVVDVYASPLTRRIILAEGRKYPDLFGYSLSEYEHYTRVRDSVSTAQIQLADMLLCPSEWVAKGVRGLSPGHSSKIRICPYGSSIDYRGRRNRPVEGRLFWAGGDWLRKGLPHLAEAAHRLRSKYPDLDFRIAGITNPRLLQLPTFHNFHFLGKLNAVQMQEEFLSADVFVFPTLSEGMAGVVIEAMAAGCPVITTTAAGVDAIENDKNGVIVSEGDVEGLTAAIERVYLERDFRSSLATNAIGVAQQYTIGAWSQRLISLLNEIL